MLTLKHLSKQFPYSGVVIWIGLRPGKKAPVKVVETVQAITEVGLDGDHYSGRPGSKRQVTLIQAEHLATIASCLQRENIDPAELRRNIVVKGINLLALKDQQFQVGEAVLEMSGLCHPCSRMEQQLGPGGYNAVRGHGGITARVISAGLITAGDQIHICVDRTE